MKNRLGSSYVTAAVKYYKILVEYLVSKDMTVDKIKQALKTALSVADDELVVSIPDAAGGRRLAETKKAAVELKVVDQDKAVTLVLVNDLQFDSSFFCLCQTPSSSSIRNADYELIVCDT